MKEFDRFSFPRNYSEKVPLFSRKFPEKFRRKFPEISELTTLPVTDAENSVQIHGDTILPQSGKNDQKRGSKFGALLWRHLTPQTKTAT